MVDWQLFGLEGDFCCLASSCTGRMTDFLTARTFNLHRNSFTANSEVDVNDRFLNFNC